MLAPRIIVAASWCALLGSCGPSGPARIGDGYPRGEDNLFLRAIRPALESSGVAIESWSVGGNGEGTMQLNTAQAVVFADNDAVVGVVGHPGSRDAILGASVYNRRGVPLVVPSATSRLVAASGPWTFPLVPNDSVEGAFIVDYAVDSLKARRVSILYVADEYGTGLRDGVKAALGNHRLDLVDQAIVPNSNCVSPTHHEVYSVIVRAALARSKPQVVVVAANGPSTWCLVHKIHAVDSTIWVIGGDGMEGERDPNGNGVPTRLRMVTFWIPGSDSLNQAFVARMRRALNRDPSAGEALVYDGYMLLADAVRAVGPDRRAIRSWLASLGTSRPAWTGVTGPVAFNQPRAGILRITTPATIP